MSTLPIIFIVLAIIAMIIKIAEWISTGENQLSEISWISSSIIWCLNSQLHQMVKAVGCLMLTANGCVYETLRIEI